MEKFPWTGQPCRLNQALSAGSHLHPRLPIRLRSPSAVAASAWQGGSLGPRPLTSRRDRRSRGTLLPARLHCADWLPLPRGRLGLFFLFPWGPEDHALALCFAPDLGKVFLLLVGEAGFLEEPF